MLEVFAGKVRKTGFFQKAGFPGNSDKKIGIYGSIRDRCSCDSAGLRSPNLLEKRVRENTAASRHTASHHSPQREPVMPLYDATVPFRRGMPVFPGDPAFQIERVSSCAHGDPFNLSLMSVATHAGTHVDPPLHCFECARGVDEIPLETLVGPGVVLDMRGRDRIDRSALQQSLVGEEVRVLFKTDNQALLLDDCFHEEFVHITVDAAEWLVARGVKLVGIDYLSIEKYDSPDALVHRTLLSAGVVIVEGVLLHDVPAGPCRIYCMPLKIRGADGAPARVVVETD
jgi:arylformamidase